METKQRRTSAGPKYLSFSLGPELYGISITHVKEILGLPTITPVPQTPEFIKGVMNLRGNILPVVDLRLKFALPFQDYGPRTCVIVVSFPREGETLTMGLVVDTIHEVLPIDTAAITTLPYINARIRSEYIQGFHEAHQKLYIILDIHRVLDDQELQATQTLGQPREEGVPHE